MVGDALRRTMPSRDVGSRQDRAHDGPATLGMGNTVVDQRRGGGVARCTDAQRPDEAFIEERCGYSHAQPPLVGSEGISIVLSPVRVEA
jgi:hypothetical protein